MEKYCWNAVMAGLVIFCWNNVYFKQTQQKQFTTEAQRAQSFTLLTTPTALLTIQSFSLCLCGEMFLSI